MHSIIIHIMRDRAFWMTGFFSLAVILPAFAESGLTDKQILYQLTKTNASEMIYLKNLEVRQANHKLALYDQIGPDETNPRRNQPPVLKPAHPSGLYRHGTDFFLRVDRNSNLDFILELEQVKIGQFSSTTTVVKNTISDVEVVLDSDVHNHRMLKGEAGHFKISLNPHPVYRKIVFKINAGIEPFELRIELWNAKKNITFPE